MLMRGAFDIMPDHLPLATVPPFVEVASPDGKIWRFAAGTKAGFAVSRIRRKLPDLSREILCIEATKEGEEPVEFGPDAELVNYGDNWKLRIVREEDYLPAKMLHQNKPGAGLNGEKISSVLHSVKMGAGQNQERARSGCKAGTEIHNKLFEVKDLIPELYPGGRLLKASKQEFISSERRKRSRNWNLHEVLLLVQAKKEEWERYENPSDRSKYETAAEKWTRVAEFLQTKGVMDRDEEQCRGKWDNLLSDFKTIKDWHRKVGNPPYASLSRDEKRQQKLPSLFDNQVMDLLESFYGRRHLFSTDHSACQSQDRDGLTDEADHFEGEGEDGFNSQKKQKILVCE